MNIEQIRQFVMRSGDDVKTDSRKVALAFKKSHSKVLRDINTLLSNCPTDFAKANFGLCFENSELQNGKPLKFYTMTKDGFMLLAMGFTGEAAVAVKVMFIEAFNWMFNYIATQLPATRQRINELSLQIQHEAGVASDCGRGLNRWRRVKPRLNMELAALTNEMQLTLPA